MSRTWSRSPFRAPLAQLCGIALILGGIAQAGCKSTKQEPVARVSPPDLQLVSAGNEPRQLVRYHAAPGTSQPLEVAIDVDLSAGEMGGPMPTIVMAMTLSVTNVLPGGDMKLHATIDNLTARDSPNSKVPAAALSGAFKQLNGLAIDAILAPNGRVRDSKLDRGGRQLPTEMESQIASLVASFESTMMPLPDEPVGVGAVWRNSRPVSQNGLVLKAVNTVTVTGHPGDVLEYSAETDMHGDDQTIPQGEVSITVSDILGNGAGKGSINLRTLALTSALTAQFGSKMTATGDSAPTKMEMTTVMNVRPLALSAATPSDAGVAQTPSDAASQGEHSAP